MSASPQLHATPIVAEDARPERCGLVLHGIYGRGRNWSTVAKQVAARRPEWRFWMTDLRLHGESPAMDPPHTLASVAGDVARLAGELSADAAPVRAIIGHSYGGKVALALAAPLSETLDQIWMIDSTPGTRQPGGSAWEMLAIVRSLPPRFSTRAEAIAALESKGLSTGVATWMTTNLRRSETGFEWMLDFGAMESLLRDFFTTDLWPVVEQPPGRVTLHVVKARESSTLDDEACARIEAIGRATGRVHLHRVDGGHWVNTENPTAITDLLVRHLA